MQCRAIVLDTTSTTYTPQQPRSIEKEKNEKTEKVMKNGKKKKKNVLLYRYVIPDKAKAKKQILRKRIRIANKNQRAQGNTTNYVTILGKNLKGSKNCFIFAEHPRFTRRDGQKHRQTPQYAPRSFPSAFLNNFPFESSFDFWRSQSVFSRGSKIRLSELGPEIRDL